MAKKKVDQGSKGVTPAKVGQPLMVKFPELSPKTDLECRVLLEDQILLVDVRLIPKYVSTCLKLL